MTLSSDIYLFHPLWERADAELCSKDAIGVFGRLVDAYIVACAIGIKEDMVLDVEDHSTPVKTIARNTYGTNQDLRELVDYMMRIALLTSKHIAFDHETRIKLAFDPDYNEKNISAAPFLTGYANYGIKQLFEHIDSQASNVAIDEMFSYLKSLEDSKYEEILKNLTLEHITL